jgi:tripartite-type tricarboxylate transporter receptor subunit TctC
MIRHHGSGAAIILYTATSLFLGMSAAMAQSEYPNRTVKIVVPNPPGTSLDVIPRIIADKQAKTWNQPIIIENRPGAAQNIGAEAVAKAEPDGYTLLVSPPGPLAVSQWFFPKLAFNPSEFVPVTVMVTLPAVLVVNPKLPVTNVQELIAYAKANPNKITYGSPGTGSTPQLAMEDLARAGGVHFTHVPYQGMGPAERDLMAGNIDAMIDIAGNALPFIRDGKMKIIAISTDKRLPELPDVPTIAEQFPSFTHAEWFAIVAPPQTPEAVAAKISRSIAETLRAPEVANRLQELVVTPVGSTPAETAAFIQRERERLRQAITLAGLKAQ